MNQINPAVTIRAKFKSSTIQAPEILKTTHLPSLDGLRAISIIFVVLSHLRGRYNSYFPRLFSELFLTKTLGVYVFFCISGFLITTLLLREKQTNGFISFRNFYIRRALRILPVSVLYIVLLFIFNRLFKMNISYIAFASALLYTVNIVSNSQMLIGHYWSLSVEEQFYLFFPFLLKKNVNTVIGIIVSLLIIIAFTRYIAVLPWFSKYVILTIFERLIKNSDGVLIGALTSILMFKSIITGNLIFKYNIYLKVICIVLIPLFYSDFIGFPLINSMIASVLICILILCCIIPTNDWIFKFLNLKLIVKLGVLSYSIYIFQQFFLIPPKQELIKSSLKVVGDVIYNYKFEYFPYNIIFILVIAYCSYTFYEKRFLRLKNKFS